eukprot:1629495-Rhodomonas_salina.2
MPQLRLSVVLSCSVSSAHALILSFKNSKQHRCAVSMHNMLTYILAGVQSCGGATEGERNVVRPLRYRSYHPSYRCYRNVFLLTLVACWVSFGRALLCDAMARDADRGCGSVLC